MVQPVGHTGPGATFTRGKATDNNVPWLTATDNNVPWLTATDNNGKVPWLTATDNNGKVPWLTATATIMEKFPG